jgi:hypothetical protein
VINPGDNFTFFMFIYVRFDFLTTVTMKIAVFWDMTPCSMVEEYRRFAEIDGPIFRVKESALQASSKQSLCLLAVLTL